MKFTSLSLLSITLICTASVNAIDLLPTFRENNYKHIAFSGSVGGSSHHGWVLSILDTLGQRGHNVSYLTTSKEIRFSSPYPQIKTVDLGESVEASASEVMVKASSGTPMADMIPLMIEMLHVNYERDFTTLREYFQESKVDLALCDHFTGSCVDAARHLKIPFIVTSTLDLSSESAAPFINNDMATMDDQTTEHQALYTRLYNKFVSPLIALYQVYPVMTKINERKRALGIDAKFESHNEAWKDSIKLVNIMPGYTPARKIGSMAEHVGPIIPKTYNPLTDELEHYLDAHKSVAYIGFGQNAVPTTDDVKFILTSLMETFERGSIDGFIWSTLNSGSLFPDTVTTSSGATYDVQGMLNHTNPHTRMMSWTPQVAILSHPSTSVFISHGGLGSWYESMYAGKPMMMFPFFGDQPGNSLIIERDGLGYILKRDTPTEEVAELFRKVTDPTGEIKQNVKRIQALTQIHSEHSVIRGADIVEEVVYTQKEGLLPHRVPVSERMSFIKSNNLDLYAVLVIVLGSALCSVFFIGFKAYHFFSKINRKQEKMKKL
ncbi:hypothetical protein BD770DRAFT_363034 [Pilaira anomala]|nr:hypothetical protein BD770DRAFT_363034 [Pilaira anomala]